MLTTEQLATLKAAILAETDPTFVAYRDSGNNGGMMVWFNEQANPAFYVWRSSIPVEEYRDAITWTEVDGLTAGKARIWDWLTANMTMPLNAARVAVRQGLADCWVANSTTRPALLAIAKRTATRAEKVLATGTGSEASPATATFEGSLTLDDIRAAVAL